jgi:hypothetical protein
VAGSLLVLAGTTGWFAASDPPAARAEGTQLFALSARADGIGVETIATGLPQVPEGKLGFVSPSGAQALIDQYSSSAFASAPNPGELVVSLPDTIDGIGGGAFPPMPDYPFYVSSNSAVTPDDREEAGPYVLAAHSDDDRATGEARVGIATASPEVVSLTSVADVQRHPDTGALVADAVARVAPFKLNDIVSVGEISGTAHMSFDPDDPDAGVQKDHSLRVGTITVAGVPLGLTEAGLVVAGSPVVPVDLAQVTSALASSGISIDYVPAEVTDTSVSTAAVAITFRRQLPDPFLDTTVRYVLGRATVSLTKSTVPGFSLPTGGALAPLGPTGGAGTGAPAAPLATPGLAAPSATTGLPIASTPAASGGGTGGGQLVAAVGGPSAAQVTDLRLLYPVLVGAGLLALASSRSVQWARFRLRAATPRQGGLHGR